MRPVASSRYSVTTCCFVAPLCSRQTWQHYRWKAISFGTTTGRCRIHRSVSLGLVLPSSTHRYKVDMQAALSASTNNATSLARLPTRWPPRYSRLRDSGCVRPFGVSIFTPAMLRRKTEYFTLKNGSPVFLPTILQRRSRTKLEFCSRRTAECAGRCC
jgi:hypothetical protein